VKDAGEEPDTYERKPFERIYHDSQSPKEGRDRFQVELSRSDREVLTREDLARGQFLIIEYQDAAAVKFWARYGIEAFSSQERATALFREVLLLNERRKKRTGADVENELRRKFQELGLDFGGNLKPRGVLGERAAEDRG
jgi:hypothetical protein